MNSNYFVDSRVQNSRARERLWIQKEANDKKEKENKGTQKKSEQESEGSMIKINRK